MTKTEVLKKFFKKFFDIDAHGWGTVSVLNDVIENNETLGGGGSSGSGSSSGIMMVNVDNDTNMLDKTWQEIYDHINGGGVAFTKYSYGTERVGQELITQVYKESESRYLVNSDDIFIANSPSDYPSFDTGTDDDGDVS